MTQDTSDLLTENMHQTECDCACSSQCDRTNADERDRMFRHNRRAEEVEEVYQSAAEEEANVEVMDGDPHC